jgi:hypothetical protein
MGIKDKDRKLLWSRAHNRCAYPQCRQLLTADLTDSTTGKSYVQVVGQEAHIRSPRPDGPRYDPKYPKPKLDTYENLVLFCPTHHGRVDGEGGRSIDAKSLVRIKQQHEQGENQSVRIATAISAYLGDQYNADDQVLFEQVELNGPRVEAMFVDVPFATSRASDIGETLSDITDEHPGDVPSTEATVITGAAQALLHPSWTGNALILGGPGQGKSTLLQYICQFHRARRLGYTDYSGEAQGLAPVTETPRIPIRIDLRDYAEWASTNPKRPEQKVGNARRRQPSGTEWPSLEQYVARHITSRSGGHSFKPRDLDRLVTIEPLLLALDGLDEVTNVSHREIATEQIFRAAARLRPNAKDLSVVVTSRPGPLDSKLLSSTQFPVFRLQRLTPGLRVQYLRKWSAVAGLTDAKRDELQETLLKHEALPHIRDLASYPMQLAILLHLLHRSGYFPTQRTDLYKEYLKTFLDREQVLNKEPLLAKDREVIVDIHALLGWRMQLGAERGESAGRISRADLRRVVNEQLADRKNDHDFATRLLDALQQRVLCLVEREKGFFQFEVASLREYFAAYFIFENAPTKGAGNTRDDCLNALLVRPSWLNVCRFFAGLLSKTEVKGLIANLRDLAADAPLTVHPHLRIVASRLLSDRAYQGQSDSVLREVIDFILDGPGVIFADDALLDDSGEVLVFSEEAGREQAIEHLKARLAAMPRNEGERLAATHMLIRHEDKGPLASWWWSQFVATPEWLRTAADLRVLTHMTAAREAQLAAAVAAMNADDVWTTELLRAGGYAGRSDDVLGVCRDEINDGSTELEGSPSGTPLDKLIEVAREAVGAPLSPQQSSPASRMRYRRVAGSTILADAVARTQEVGVLPAAADATAWAERLKHIAGIWGDGWVLRQAVDATPRATDLTEVIRKVENTNQTLRSAIERTAAARSNRGDPDWWKKALADAGSSLDRRWWLHAALTTAQATTVAALASELSAVADELTPKQYRVAEAAVTSFARLQNSPLNLRDPLRLKQVTLAARALWLLRRRVTGDTREQIDKKLTADFPALLVPGMGDRRQVLRIIGAQKTIKVDVLRDTRAVIPGGAWAGDIHLGKISAATANAILKEPSEWPADVVALAIQQAGDGLSRLKPIASLTTADRWFNAS